MIFFGNKVESSSDGTNKIYRYNDKNQLTSIKSKDGLTDIYYDKNGNVRDHLLCRWIQRILSI